MEATITLPAGSVVLAGPYKIPVTLTHETVVLSHALNELSVSGMGDDEPKRCCKCACACNEK